MVSSKTATRRGILRGAGVAAALAGSVGLGGSRALASAGDALTLGQANDADGQPTSVTANVAGPDQAFSFTNTSGSGPALRVVGEGSLTSGTTGPLGALTASAQDSAAVVGLGNDGVGVYGDGEARGIPRRPLGAVTAETNGGYGVVGSAEGANGIGVVAQGSGKWALSVRGGNSFSQAGRTTIGAGQVSRLVGGASLKVSVGALILATLQGDPAGVHVVSARRIDAHHFRVFLSAAAPAGGVTVGYFVLN